MTRFARPMLAAILVAVAAPTGVCAATLVTSFNPGLGSLEAIAFDPVAGTLFLFHDGSGVIREFTTAGVEVLPMIPAGAGSFNDTDLDFVTSSFTLGGITLPAGSLIEFNGDAAKIQALDKGTGALITQVAAAIALQGGFVMPLTSALFGVDWGTDTIAELDPGDGHVLGSFSIYPPGSPTFGIYFGDVESCPGENVFLVAGTEYSFVRGLSSAGTWLGDLDLSGLGIGVGEIGGLAVDDATGHLWIAGRSGTVYELSEVCVAFTFFRDGFESTDTSQWSSTTG